MLLGIFLIKMYEYTMLFSTVASCLNIWMEWAAAGFMGLALRRIGLSVGSILSYKILYHLGSRIAVMIGALLMANQAIFLYILRRELLTPEGIYASVMVSAFFGGIGSNWVEEGFYSYMGYLDRRIPLKRDTHIDEYFKSNIYKIKLHCQ